MELTSSLLIMSLLTILVGFKFRAVLLLLFSVISLAKTLYY
jgi:hypothetical protein